jgi:hypothetical protein
MRVEAYAAVTTNSCSSAARRNQLWDRGTGVFGYLGLDNHPLGARWLRVDLVAGVGVRVFGITVASVELRLSLGDLHRGGRWAPAWSASVAIA